MKARLNSVLAVLIIVSLLLAACQQEVVKTVTVKETQVVKETQIVTDVQVVKETQVVRVEVTPTPAAVVRRGAWVDTMVFTSIDQSANAVAQLQADALDLYAYLVEDPDVKKTVDADSSLDYRFSYGSWDSMLLNPSGPTFNDGRLNPFQNQKIREAMNWMIDRDYLVQETVGGMGMAKYVILNTAFPDYARYADLIRPLEAKYAYDLEKARSAVKTEMEGMGATLSADGKWTFNDKPVVIIGLIRSEDERQEIGNYFSDQLEAIGFTVDRQVRTRTELAPIWQQSDPTEGQWHFYTGGNYYPVMRRNDASAFAETYTSLTASTTAEEAFNPSPELLQVSQDLLNNNYSSMEERRELFAKALVQGLENSQYVQVLSTYSFFPRKANLEVASDLSSGVGGSALWPYTIRWKGQEGGVVRSANSGILTGPWNPIAGQNWIQELMLIRGTMDDAALTDPYTGLNLPQRIEKADVQVVKGLPIDKTLDWVSLEFVDKIDVPADTWVDWDAKKQEFITAAQKWPEGMTARSKITVTYPADIWNIKWHDGSTLSMGDFVTYMVQTFDLGNPDSPAYDESQASTLEALMQHFKGVRIVSTNPLVIETYEDQVDLDAENQVGNYFTNRWWPITNTGPVAWHSFNIGLMAEINKEAAFSASKSTELGVEWLHYIDGPSLAILKKNLDTAIAENTIPYAPTLSKFITVDEAKTRYANLRNWFTTKGHFWIGTGLFYLEQVNSVEGSVVMQRNPDFPDPADKWSGFGDAMFITLDTNGPAKVTAGQEARFDAVLTYDNAPYPADKVDSVFFLVYDAAGSLVMNGFANAVSEGQYQAVLSAEDTKKLAAGANRIEFIATSKAVAMPVFSSFEFVVAAQ